VNSDTELRRGPYLLDVKNIVAMFSALEFVQIFQIPLDEAYSVRRLPSGLRQSLGPRLPCRVIAEALWRVKLNQVARLHKNSRRFVMQQPPCFHLLKKQDRRKQSLVLPPMNLMPSSAMF
jgi:hypothetical protein